MGLLKLLTGKSAEEIERKGDALFEAGEHGLAKMEYEHGLEKCKKSTEGNEALETRLKEKLHKTKEALALKHKDEGLEIMESEYYEGAEDSFRLALELTGDPALVEELQGLLDEIARRSGKEEASLYDHGSSYEKGPDEGEPEAADEEYFAALCSPLPEPVRKEFYQYGMAFREGYIALNKGNFELAAHRLEQAMGENTEEGFISIELATAYLNLEKYQKARVLAEEFLKARPDSLQGYQVLCEILWSTEAFDEALEWLDACPDTLAESVALLVLRGETLFKAQRLEEAEGLYDKQMKKVGWQADIARSLARIYEAQGKKKEARDLFGKLLAESRTCGSMGDTFTRQRFADLSFELGEYSSSVLEHYLSLVQEDHLNRADYYQKISRIYAAQGNEAEARRFEGFARQAQREPFDT